MAPDEWQDAGEALDNDELKGCLMPKGEAKKVQKNGGYLQYNEVSHALFSTLIFRLSLMNSFSVHRLQHGTDPSQISPDGENELDEGCKGSSLLLLSGGIRHRLCAINAQRHCIMALAQHKHTRVHLRCSCALPIPVIAHFPLHRMSPMIISPSRRPRPRTT